jgi:radical SAM protein with 4Fe4S-binding SPASM domain
MLTDTGLATRDYATWTHGLKQRVGDKRLPLGGTLELTHRCNNRCRHCFNNRPQRDGRALSRELTTREACRILEDAAGMGCVWVLLTGGEILLRPDLLEIYDHARRAGLLITLFTNGTLVTPALAEHLDRHRPLAIEITLYGATPATHDLVTATPGSYDACLNGIRLLQERGLPLKLKSTVSTLNRHELAAMRRMAQDELGLPFRFDALLNPRCDGRPGPLGLRLDAEAVVALDLADLARAEALREFAETHRTPGNGTGKLYPCSGGAHSFAVDPYGRLRACAITPGEGFDLRTRGLREGWDSHLARLGGLKLDRDAKCRTCGLRALCGMCPANGELECGDPRRPVDFLCRVAHLRAQVFGIPIPPHGRCEYCPGGVRHEELRLAAARLKDGRAPHPLLTLIH